MDAGDNAWVVMYAGVAGYDAWAYGTGRPTMSAAFFRAWKHPVKRWPTLFWWAFITAHLFGVIPKRFDPLRRWG